MNYVIVDEYSIYENIDIWIANEIENIKNNLTEDDYQIGMEVIKKLSLYSPNKVEIERDFQNVLKIISTWEDIQNAYGVELII